MSQHHLGKQLSLGFCLHCQLSAVIELDGFWDLGWVFRICCFSGPPLERPKIWIRVRVCVVLMVPPLSTWWHRVCSTLITMFPKSPEIHHY